MIQYNARRKFHFTKLNDIDSWLHHVSMLVAGLLCIWETVIQKKSIFFATTSHLYFSNLSANFFTVFPVVFFCCNLQWNKFFIFFLIIFLQLFSSCFVLFFKSRRLFIQFFELLLSRCEWRNVITCEFAGKFIEFEVEKSCWLRKYCWWGKLLMLVVVDEIRKCCAILQFLII